MEDVKIIWSGITGRTGTQALAETKKHSFAKIVAGICRNNENYYNYDNLNNIELDFDIIVDFSHKDSFDKILEFALIKRKPLVIGTANLSEEQELAIEKASYIIPVFRGGNFRFDVQKFMDDVLNYAKNTDNKLVQKETNYKTKKIPSQTAQELQKRVLKETNKYLEIQSFLEYDELINDYRCGPLHCRVIGFESLAFDILKICSLMKDKPANGIWNLHRLLINK